MAVNAFETSLKFKCGSDLIFSFNYRIGTQPIINTKYRVYTRNNNLRDLPHGPLSEIMQSLSMAID